MPCLVYWLLHTAFPTYIRRNTAGEMVSEDIHKQRCMFDNFHEPSETWDCFVLELGQAFVELADNAKSPVNGLMEGAK